MRTKYILHSLLLGLCALGVSSCDRLDVVGMFWSSGSHTEDRVAEWLAWDEQHGPNVITGVPDAYSVYVCSDIHITDSAPRVEQFLNKEYLDPQAVFSVINGDIANVSGESAFRVLDSVMHLPRPDNHVPGPAEDTCFVVIGNHDIYFNCQEYYQKYFHTSTYCVEVRTVGGKRDLWVFLDSGNATHGRRQLVWLKELLEHRSEYRHVVVNTHTCLFRNSYNYSTTPAANLPEEEYYELVKLMSDNQVSLFLMGHFHHKEEHVLGGVPYVMSSNMDVQDEVPSYLRVSLGEGVDYEYKNLY